MFTTTATAVKSLKMRLNVRAKCEVKGGVEDDDDVCT